MARTSYIHHRFHLAILGGIFVVTLLAAGPFFNFLLGTRDYPAYEREFAKVFINGTTVFAEVARSPEERERGLSGRTELGSENGMLFVFDDYAGHSFWMKQMKIPLDIIWIAGSRIVDIEENVPFPKPGTPENALPVYRPDVPANLVLEVEAGFAESNGIRIGSMVSFISQEEMDVALAKKELENRKEQLRLTRSLVANHELKIESLQKRTYTGRDFTIGKKLSENSAYVRYQISYKSDGLTISGVMNVPTYGKPPYPVIILNHGYIDPEEYSIGRGSKREQDYFARRGYATIHPDYRGYGASSPDPAARYDFNVGYTIDVMNLIEALKKQPPLTLDVSRLGMWGHSMGGGITERVMVLRKDIKAYVLFAPISSNISDTLYLVQGKITDIERDYGIDDTTEKLFAEASPWYYLSSVIAPIMIHHGEKDAVVPVGFSRVLNKTLLRNRKTSLLFTYENERHEFTRAWPLVMTRSLNFFDQFVKYPKIRR